MREFFKTYKWPIICIILLVCSLYLKFGLDFFCALIDTIKSRSWWVENLLTFIVFSALVSWIVSLTQKARQRHHQARYEGWKVYIEGVGKTVVEQDLYWSEVEAYLASSFERWKFIKSLASGAYDLTLPVIDDAESGPTPWIKVGDEKDKKIYVNFSRALEVGHARLKPPHRST